MLSLLKSWGMLSYRVQQLSANFFFLMVTHEFIQEGKENRAKLQKSSKEQGIEELYIREPTAQEKTEKRVKIRENKIRKIDYMVIAKRVEDLSTSCLANASAKLLAERPTCLKNTSKRKG